MLRITNVSDRLRGMIGGHGLGYIEIIRGSHLVDGGGFRDCSGLGGRRSDRVPVMRLPGRFECGRLLG